jgi:hypothetical protein
MSKLIHRVTVIQTVDGERVAHELVGPKKKAKKRPRWARPMARAEQRLLDAQAVFWSELRERQGRANEKNAWGSVRRAPKNAAQALRKAMKKLQ